MIAQLYLTVTIIYDIKGGRFGWELRNGLPTLTPAISRLGINPLEVSPIFSNHPARPKEGHNHGELVQLAKGASKYQD